MRYIKERRMANKEITVGDKFVIEVGHVYWSPDIGNRYFIKGFNSLVFDDIGISRLEKYKEPPREIPHTCEFCKYQYCPMENMPCVVCDKNVFEPRDMFEAMK